MEIYTLLARWMYTNLLRYMNMKIDIVSHDEENCLTLTRWCVCECAFARDFASVLSLALSLFLSL